MRRRVTTAALATIVGLGAVGVGVIAVPAVAATVTGEATPSQAISDRVSKIRDALKGLVDDGTLTQAQADKVASTLGNSDVFPGPGMGHGFGGHLLGRDALQAAATALGMSEADVMTALRDGSTIADLAKKQNKDVADVEAAVVKAIKANIDQAVKDKKFTQEQADKLEANLADRVHNLVTSGMPGKAFGRGNGGWMRHGGPGSPSAPKEGATPAPTATTSA